MIPFITGLPVGLFCGAFAGFIMAAFCNISSSADAHIEMMDLSPDGESDKESE